MTLDDKGMRASFAKNTAFKNDVVKLTFIEKLGLVHDFDGKILA